jgi:hypothetical protein
LRRTWVAGKPGRPDIAAPDEPRDCLTGKSVRRLICPLSSPISKNISVRSMEGRLEIVTDAGQDAVDADALSDERR